MEATNGREHLLLLYSSLRCLDELAVPNWGVARSTAIIRKLIANMALNKSSKPAGLSMIRLFRSGCVVLPKISMKQTFTPS